MTDSRPIQVTTFDLFPVNQLQTFDIILANRIKQNDLIVTISNPILGQLDKQLDWQSTGANNKCRVSFRAPTVGIYTINIELTNQQTSSSCTQFQAKAYDLSKVFINGSSGKCRVNESYEFGVDASEAGEGQLEIAVNEGEIPNQVQVLDNGKCIVNFVPEDAVPHVVDIKFNGHNVNGCPFVVEVENSSYSNINSNNQHQQRQQVPNILGEPNLIKDDRVIVDSPASFTLENIALDNVDSEDLVIVDPENRSVDCNVIQDSKAGRFKFEFTPTIVGDYAVELKPKSQLLGKLPNSIIEQFPFSLKVFDYNKVIVSDVTDGVVGHPIYFFIDASQAGSGNLEIRVSSTTRNVPNYPQSEANAKIRVYFTPTEAVDHSIDVKFNGIPVPNNPFLVRVSQFPQARLPVTSQDLLKYVAVDEFVSFYIDYLGNNTSELTDKSCQVFLLKPDFSSTKLSTVELIKLADKSDKQQTHFKIGFRPTKIGPYKLFITVNNEILPGSPILSNVYNIHEVKVFFEQTSSTKPIGKVNEPVTFTVDASRAGEGTLALAVVSSLSRSPVQTEVKVSDKGHGLYNLTFVPTESAPHSIDMSFNDRVVPNSPFVVDILNAKGESSTKKVSNGHPKNDLDNDKDVTHKNITQEFEAMSLKQDSAAKLTGANKSKPNVMSREDELLQSIVVHGISLKRTPVSSTGAFIIETNRIAQARDFDVLIADPSNSLVDVQCYLQQDGNLLAEWTPERVGMHKIEVLYKNRSVPGSPFIAEAFDPSSVIIESLKSTAFSLDDVVEIRINRKEAGHANLEVVLTDPKGEDQSLDIQQSTGDDAGETVRFKPTVPGKYKLSITFGGYEVPKSPMIITVRDNREPVKVSGPGLRCAEKNRTAQFNVESSSDGELKLRIECGNREIVPRVERKARFYTIKYKPTDVGYASISLYWNGSHIEGSPYSVPVNDLSGFVFINSADNNQPISNQIALDYAPRVSREIIVDTSKCGPGELKAEAYCRANPNIKFSIPVNEVATDRYKLVFTCPPGPEQLANGIALKDFSLEATYLIRFYYNNFSVPETMASVLLSPPSRSNSTSTSVDQSTAQMLENNNNNFKQPVKTIENVKSEHDEMTSCPIVALRGYGLVEAKCGEKAEFTIDGRNAGYGEPEVRFNCSEEEIKVKLELIEDKLYKATYVAQKAGSYSMNVLWSGKQVAGCPITVKIAPDCDPSKVVCTADSLKGGVLGEEIKTFIDTRKAGPGELTALCTGPQKVAFCELLDRDDGTFILYIKPQEAGRHFLTINYGGQHIPKSPFSFKVSGKPDPSKVRVYGPGVEHGVLSLYQSRFVCDTRGAGAGQLTVRIRGPKGAFRMETQRESQRDRTILCKYDPTEPGDYRIEIKWSGRHVPGSPFSVMIFDTQEELNRFFLSQQQHNAHTNKVAGSSVLHQQVPFQPTLVEYGHYPNKAQTAQQPQFRLQ